ncbi:MAG: hypothetical protein ACR2JF_07925 [Iamia sp.]
MPRSRLAAGALVAALVLAATGCGGDDDSGSDTTTTSPNLPPTDSPLEDQLLAPATVGDGYASDDTLGG